MADKIVGIIGGSGLYELEGLSDVKETRVPTPFGEPSDVLVTGRLGDTQLIFLPRHGRGHRIAPGEINFRANIYAMKKLGVEWILSVSAVGSMKESIAPGHLVVVDQFIDRTKQRISTFFGEGAVGHVSFADPICPVWSKALYASTVAAGATVHQGGTYIVIEGPQFSSRAESRLYRSWGVDVIGMTNLPEAKLAREAEICYATLALSTDYDCWHETEEDVTVEAVLKVVRSNVDLAKRTIREIATRIPAARDCVCATASAHALMTTKSEIPATTREKLQLLFGKYWA